MADTVEWLRQLPHSRAWSAASEIERLRLVLKYAIIREDEHKAEIERLRNGIQDYLDGDWGREYRKFPTRHDQCPHKKFEWEDCGNCIDEYFAKLLIPTSVSPANEKAP